LGFQSLTGSIHTWRRGILNARKRYVSIPHRFDSHAFISVPKTSSRFCFNPSQVRFTQYFFPRVFPDEFAFQSLTGSIHTLFFGWWVKNLLYRFNPSQVRFTPWISIIVPGDIPVLQSLTGSIHTNLWIKNKFSFKKFQSLTGSIHTLSPKGGAWYNFTVSIPHRFDSHNQKFTYPNSIN